MSEILKATCKGKSTNIECRRPSWESIKMSYATINNEYKKGAAEAVFKKIGGEPLSEIIIRWIKFNKNKKMYVYTKEEK